MLCPLPSRVQPQCWSRCCPSAPLPCCPGLVSHPWPPVHLSSRQVPADAAELAAVQRRLAARYPAAAFAAARRRLDPKNVLGSPTIDALLPRGDS